MKVTAKAPGKMIWLGEYAVLEGAPALVVAVDRYARVTLQPLPQEPSLLTAPEIGISALPFSLTRLGEVSFSPGVDATLTNKLNFFVTTLKTAYSILQQRNQSISPLHITIRTDEFFIGHGADKIGLGSSAAVTVALLAALFKMAGVPYRLADDRRFLYQQAWHIHRKAQGGVGSGIDVAASVFGGILNYQLTDPSTPGQVIPYPALPDLHYITLWTGQSASTRELVVQVNRFKEHHREQFRQLMNEMYQLSDAGCAAYFSHNTGSFLTIVRQYLRAMERLGNASGTEIVSPKEHQLAQQVEALGAAYKPSGAGGGDLGIIFFTRENTAGKILPIVEKLKFQLLTLDIDIEGVM